MDINLYTAQLESLVDVVAQLPSRLEGFRPKARRRVRCLDTGLLALNRDINAVLILAAKKRKRSAKRCRWRKQRHRGVTLTKYLAERVEHLRLGVEIICAQIAYCLINPSPVDKEDDDLDGMLFFLTFRTLLGREVYASELSTCSALLSFLGTGWKKSPAR
jgi:hypothetical protein